MCCRISFIGHFIEEIQPPGKPPRPLQVQGSLPDGKFTEVFLGGGEEILK